jgi:hypothetical protein
MRRSAASLLSVSFHPARPLRSPAEMERAMAMNRTRHLAEQDDY